MKRPLFWGLLYLGLAIILSFKQITAAIMLLFCLPLIMAPFFIKSFKYSQLAFVLFIYLVGLLLGQQAFTDGSIDQVFYKEELAYSGVINSYPEFDDDRVSFLFNSDSISDRTIDALFKVVYYEEDQEMLKRLKPGDKIVFNGQLRKNTGIRNPGAFDYSLYLKSMGIAGQLVLKSDLEIRGNDSGFKEKLLLLKKGTETKIEKTFTPIQADLLKGILLGEDISNDQTKDTFQDIGIAHVLAVSGLHVGFIYLMILTLLQLIKIDQKYHLFLMLPILLLYIFLTGCSASVVRASVMLFILLLGDGLHVEKDGLNNIFLAAIIILLIWPAQLFQAGFQLSVAAVSGIILFNASLNYQFERWINRRQLKYKSFNNPLIEAFILTLAALLGSFPIMMYHFGDFSGITFLANLILIPLLGMLVVSGFLFLLISGVFSFLTPYLARPLSFLMDTVLVSAKALDALNQKLVFLNIKDGRLDLALAGIMLLTGFVLAGYFSRRYLKKAVFLLYGILTVTLVLKMTWPGNLEIIVLDVGQGDSILINTPEHQHYLIDGGGYLFERENRISDDVLYPALRVLGISQFEGVFLSHNHEDHKQGIEEIIADGFEIKHLFMSTKTNNQYLLEQTDVPVSLLANGVTIETDDIKFEVLSPTAEVERKPDSEQNNASLVLLLSYQDSHFLFCGDIEEEAEAQIINDLKERNMDIQVIKVPHHGSETSSTQGFIEAVEPELGIISVGENNLYGHPDQDVLKRYEEAGTKILRTDLNGAIVIKSNGDWIKWETYLD